jgi:hypothetical protein
MVETGLYIIIIVGFALLIGLNIFFTYIPLYNISSIARNLQTLPEQLNSLTQLEIKVTEFISDVEEFIDAVQNFVGNAECFALCYSLGGSVTECYGQCFS